MEGLATAFLYNIKGRTIVLIQKLNRPRQPFALPGGVIEEQELPRAAAVRETMEEVGQKAADAVAQAPDEIEIDRGEYKQHIFCAPYNSPLRKTGWTEKDGRETTGPPMACSFEQIMKGFVNGRKIYSSHLMAIHECASMLTEDWPEEFGPLAEATQKYAFVKK